MAYACMHTHTHTHTHTRTDILRTYMAYACCFRTGTHSYTCKYVHAHIHAYAHTHVFIGTSKGPVRIIRGQLSIASLVQV